MISAIDAATALTELDRIRWLLRRNQFDQALVRAKSLLGSAPTERDALLFSAIARRRLGQMNAAAEVLDELAKHLRRITWSSCTR